MQNPHVIWRINLAHSLAECIASFQGVRAIVAAGSTARNYADEYSDLEIPVFWDWLPDDTQRHALVSKLNAKFLFAYNGHLAEDQLLINGVQVDLWHIAVAEEEDVIKAVLEGCNQDLSSLNAMDTVRSCIALYGHALIEKWKKQAQAYPEKLAGQIIQNHITSFKITELLLLASRDNPAAFYGQLSLLHQEIFLVLLALNRHYFPTFKWLFPALDTMQVKPGNINQRIRQAYKLPCCEAIADTRRILEETLGLVEQQFPHLDTAIVHKQLAYTRTAHYNFNA